jgi:preprotein translocase subunit SecF
VSTLSRLYNADTHIDFVGHRKRWFTFSAVILVISVISLLTRGLDLSLDFEGGTVVEVPNAVDASTSDVRDALSDIGLAGAKVQLTEGTDGARIRVQTEVLEPAAQDELIVTVTSVGGVEVDEASFESVGPTFGEQITQSAIRALVIFLAVIALFISWRFEWKMAAAGLLALFHDLIITAGIYSVTGFEVTPATVIAILTILGYSLYDTVVVFDKILEEIEEYGDEMEIGSIVNLAMNSVLMRSINTSLTSLLPVGSLLFVGSFLLGAATLREFALALFVGIAAGTYSSIFIAAPLVAVWKAPEEKWQRTARRAARKAVTPEVRPEPAVVASDVPAASPTAPPPRTGSGAAPRPPKRRRKKR